MKRALMSVYDKTGVVEFARKLVSLGFEIVSTGGTQAALAAAAVPVSGVSDITGFPECLDGRLKTLHPMIHGGLLAQRGVPEHVARMEELGIGMIDILAVNLYPFKQTVAKPGVSQAEIVENIDIGGPAMLRAAAKNYPDVAAIVDPEDYAAVLAELEAAGAVSLATKTRLAAKVFMHTADYDASIAAYMKKAAGIELFPKTLTLTFEKAQDMRYGENPHQNAAFYKEAGPALGGMLTEVVQLHGKELSFNNINDTHGALELIKEFGEPAVVACKHSNPCGAACGADIYEAWRKAYSCDPVSIFGGIIVANRPIDFKTAEEISKIFVEIVLAPAFEPDALKILSKKKNIRLLTLDNIGRKQPEGSLDIKKVSGGVIVQEVDNALLPDELQYVTSRRPTGKEMEDLVFTWKIVKFTKSNGIAIGKDKRTVGVGPGQVNRIWATEQAIEHGVKTLGADAVKGAVLASD
ncbi:MAG: bifunctional phosphoribosylaminoimidazolecarboxamide formyltransferase/IMP cyclohydrolase, partial [Defluviitaleaceae bacterium]|nr:bifunctional phosphoribosylaminoimidazolecarboxamide formyltransferase/IMP cyclohydrolase [Defluviitaleaceae bacterium]